MNFIINLVLIHGYSQRPQAIEDNVYLGYLIF